MLHAVCKQKHITVNNDAVPVTTRFEAWVCGSSLAGFTGLNTPEGMDVCVCVSLVSVACCQVDISASG